MMNCLAQVVVLDEKNLGCEFVHSQKLEGISLCSNGKQTPNLKLL